MQIVLYVNTVSIVFQLSKHSNIAQLSLMVSACLSMIWLCDLNASIKALVIMHSFHFTQYSSIKLVKQPRRCLN